ncbi:hypothetical protein K2P97_13615 [bacterium]|nr:hypothetical protein [bacterium]
MQKIILPRVLLLILLVASCQQLTERSDVSTRQVAANPNDNWTTQLPLQKATAQNIKDMMAVWEKKRSTIEKKIGGKSTITFEQMQNIARYLDFLNLSDAERKAAMDRLFESSTQFLFCNDLEDWSCLEKTPEVTPLAAHRRDAIAGLGEPVRVNENLNIEYHFSKQWYKTRKQMDGTESKVPEKASLGDELAKLLEKDWKKISMAIYGIDGVGELDQQSKKQNYSMLPVMKAIKKHSDIRAVVDVENYKNNTESGKREIIFQYPPTMEMCTALNENLHFENNRVRLEWPPANIMHNKFFVFDDGRDKSVWTGTANVSKNCMGDEDFANMAVYIKNTEVAEAYLAEFEEMFNFSKPDEIKAPTRVGRFHKNKKPNTQRYFIFNDETELRVHFSPTDDGEHRSILPMLLSARDGDVIRISMFGSGGSEYVRAIQYAVAQGAHVKLFLDRDTSFQVANSWINRKAPVKVQSKNPYGIFKGKLEIRHTNWGAGNMNHHKTASLARKTPKGMLAQQLIVGSQNWSLPGNDENDENMLSIRNTKNGLLAAKAFSEHFDAMIWPTGKVVEQEFPAH